MAAPRGVPVRETLPAGDEYNRNSRKNPGYQVWLPSSSGSNLHNAAFKICYVMAEVVLTRCLGVDIKCPGT